jgi:outer membrane lipoprotein-sorting protein
MRSRNVFLALAAVAAVSLVGVAPAAEDLPDPGDSSLSSMDRVTALIERMRIEQKSFRSLEAQFEQRTESEMLVEPEVARGAFFYQAPDKVRWEYYEPTPKIILVDGDQMTTWYQDLGKAETLRVGRHSDRVLKYLGASGSLETLMEYFTLRVRWPEAGSDGAPFRLTLSPLYERIAKRLEVIHVDVDSRRFIPVRLHYVEPSGDETDYLFKGVETNTELDPALFELDLPPGVVVTKRNQP